MRRGPGAAAGEANLGQFQTGPCIAAMATLEFHAMEPAGMIELSAFQANTQRIVTVLVALTQLRAGKPLSHV